MFSVGQAPRASFRGKDSLRFLLSFLAVLTFVLAAPVPAIAQDAPPPADTAATAENPDAEVALEETEVADAEEGEKKLVVPGVPLTKRFAQGGWVMFVLLGLSLIMVTFGIERFMNLRRSTIVPQGLADRARDAWRSGDMKKVIAVAEEKPSVLASAIIVLARHRHVPGNDVSIMAGDEVSRLMRRHLQKAYPLAIVATLAPLLGLLGTVLGMIDAFEVVAIAGSLGDASILASGIAKALVTTAFGLIVAIPALGLYHHFRGRTHEFALEVEEEVGDLISDWFHPAESESASTK